MTRKKFVVVDIDGTLADAKHRIHLIEQEPQDRAEFVRRSIDDPAHQDIVDLVVALNGYFKIIFCTGRSREDLGVTVQWLKSHFPVGVCTHPDVILMRDRGDDRHDSEVKAELLARVGLTPADVLCILDDRTSVVKNWRRLGYTCLQVAEGDF
jgi:hypothetical protein